VGNRQRSGIIGIAAHFRRRTTISSNNNISKYKLIGPLCLFDGIFPGSRNKPLMFVYFDHRRRRHDGGAHQSNYRAHLLKNLQVQPDSRSQRRCLPATRSTRTCMTFLPLPVDFQAADIILVGPLPLYGGVRKERVFIRTASHYIQKMAATGNKAVIADEVKIRESSSVKERRDGRAVYCTGLENRRSERIRGFESHSLRQANITCLAGSSPNCGDRGVFVNGYPAH
jgi:hypothetical protein